MIYYFQLISLICLTQPWPIAPITTQTDPYQPKNFRRHAGPAPPNDWELGLREAVHQALLREHHTDPGIRDRLIEAPFINRHDGASPFGDIAVLARGQLYATPTGFKFVQDQNDCNTKQCQQWQNIDYNNLLALWTVKRIRHRDPKYGYVFEIEYTISPITPAINEEILMRHGFFNYNVPGHIFVIKSDPRLNSAYYLKNNKFQHDKYEKNEPNYGEKPGVLIGIAPNGYKHVLQSLPGFYTSYHPSVTYPDQTTIDPKEYELYKKLIESLASKTTQPQHAFVETPQHRFTVTSTTPKLVTKPKPENAVVHFPNSITSSKPIRFPVTTNGKYSEPDIYYHTVPPTLTVPVLIHSDIFDDGVKQPPTTTNYVEKTTNRIVPTVGTQYTETNSLIPSFGTKIPGYTTPFVTEPRYTTIPSQKTTTNTEKIVKPETTIYYYTPTEEVQFSSTKKTQKPITTSKYTTKPPPPDINDDFDLFPAVEPTEAMKPVTEPSNKIVKTTPPSVENVYPSSVNDQLPPPNAGVTIPYVTVTETPVTTTQKITTTKIATTIKENLETTNVNVETTEADNFKTTTGVTTGRQDVTVSETIPSLDTTTIGKIDTTTNVFTTNRVEEEKKNEVTVKTTIPTTVTNPVTSTILQDSTYTSNFIETDQPKTTTNIITSTIPQRTETTLNVETTKKPFRKTTLASNVVDDDFFAVPIDQTKQPSNTNKDVNEDDIFGQTKRTTSLKPQKTTKKQPIQSDLADALFGGDGNRRPKQIKVSQISTSTTPLTTSKIIYDNFYAPSTEPIIPTTQYFDETTPRIITFQSNNYQEGITKLIPVTDTSVSTSISFEVNKRNNNNTNPVVELDPTIAAQVTEIVDPKNKFAIYRAELPLTTTTTERGVNKNGNKQVFDNFALQLVNHAKSIDYLGATSGDLSTTKKTRQPKYKRRRYDGKRRASQRRNSNSSN